MKKFSNLDEQITTKYESKDSLRNDIYSLIENSLSIKIFGESALDKDISITGKEELVEKIKNLIDETKIKERVITLEHVKANVHRNFDMNWLNEQIDNLKRFDTYSGDKVNIEITKCSNDNFWYKDLIGENFVAIDSKSDNGWKIVPTEDKKDLLGGSWHSVLYVKKDDAVVK